MFVYQRFFGHWKTAESDNNICDEISDAFFEYCKMPKRLAFQFGGRLHRFRYNFMVLVNFYFVSFIFIYFLFCFIFCLEESRLAGSSRTLRASRESLQSGLTYNARRGSNASVYDGTNIFLCLPFFPARVNIYKFLTRREI